MIAEVLNRVANQLNFVHSSNSYRPVEITATDAARSITSISQPENKDNLEFDNLEASIKGFSSDSSEAFKACALELALHLATQISDKSTDSNLTQAFNVEDSETLRALIQVFERQGDSYTDPNSRNSFSVFQQNYARTYNVLSEQYNSYQTINCICQSFKDIGTTSSNKPSKPLEIEITEFLEKIYNNEFLQKKYPSLVAKLQSKIHEKVYRISL